YLKPVDRLPLSDIPDYVSVATFGWGQISDQDAGISDELRWVNVVSLTNAECQITYGNQITDKMVCVEGNYNEGTCNGDVGGALIQYYSTGHAIPVGISSFVSGNGCESTDPSGFTRTYPYNDWIRNVDSIPSGIDTRIIGGTSASIHEYPYAAAIDVQTSNSRFFCGGALYTRQFVITAGQCVDGAVIFTVHLGSANLNDPNRLSLATSEYVLHPEYDAATLANDIGLIKFRMPIEFTDYIKSINYLAIAPISTHKIRAIGWGQVNDEDASLSNELKYVYVSPLSNTECKKIYGGQILDTMVCVEGNYNEGACHGDTGSPLVDIYSRYHSVHVGISS
ncbi:brachyurin-like, partial [Asbolus verrucosus]